MNQLTPKSLFSLLLGPALFLSLVWWGGPSSMNTAAWHVLSTTVWMAVWWITGVVHIAVTSLLPILLFPLTGALSLTSTTASFGHKYVFLYLGGFMLAIAIQKWELHQRLALYIIRLLGSNQRTIILGFMIATAFLSMWISNTATSVMMLPIGIAVVSQFEGLGNTKEKQMNSPFSKSLMLSIAYSASIGGMGTLIGTPPNLLLASSLEISYNIKIGFAQWMAVGIPISILLLLFTWWILTRIAFQFKNNAVQGQSSEIEKMWLNLKKITFEESMVLILFIITALLWMSRSILERWIPMIDDTLIATTSGIMLFLIPTKRKVIGLINWNDCKKLPWDIILLFGGGLALAKGFSETGLALWVANQLSTLHGFSLFVLILVLVASVNFLSEITSNLATTAMLLPVLAPMVLAIGHHPFMILVPVTLAASCAFMLPVATPPNAVVFGSGYLAILDMVRVGFWLNILSILLVSAWIYFFLPIIWNLTPENFIQMIN